MVKLVLDNELTVAPVTRVAAAKLLVVLTYKLTFAKNVPIRAVSG